MESTPAPTSTNGSCLSPNASNDSFGLTKDTRNENTDYVNIALLTLCSLGLPANLLIIAVYVRNMTSSLRVYMLALAVADTAICVRVIIALQAPTNVFIRFASLYVFHMAVIFSTFLLVFVAIERLTAILRPHSFNTNPRRAWKALLIIGAAAIVFEALFVVMKELHLYGFILNRAKVGTSIASLLIIAVCYTWIAAKLLASARLARNRVSTFNPTASTKPRCPRFVTVQRIECRETAGPSTVMTSASVVPINKITAKQTTAYKSVLLLFVITVVFIVCCLPFWLHNLGVHVMRHLKRLFVLNSVVNPFIYGVASAMFREDVRQFYRQTRVKLAACYR